MSKADIMAEIDAGDTGLGAYSGSISVEAEAGQAVGGPLNPLYKKR